MELNKNYYVSQGESNQERIDNYFEAIKTDIIGICIELDGLKESIDKEVENMNKIIKLQGETHG